MEMELLTPVQEHEELLTPTQQRIIRVCFDQFNFRVKRFKVQQLEAVMRALGLEQNPEESAKMMDDIDDKGSGVIYSKYLKVIAIKIQEEKEKTTEDTKKRPATGATTEAEAPKKQRGGIIDGGGGGGTVDAGSVRDDGGGSEGRGTTSSVPSVHSYWWCVPPPDENITEEYKERKERLFYIVCILATHDDTCIVMPLEDFDIIEKVSHVQLFREATNDEMKRRAKPDAEIIEKTKVEAAARGFDIIAKTQK